MPHVSSFVSYTHPLPPPPARRCKPCLGFWIKMVFALNPAFDDKYGKTENVFKMYEWLQVSLIVRKWPFIIWWWSFCFTCTREVVFHLSVAVFYLRDFGEFGSTGTAFYWWFSLPVNKEMERNENAKIPRDYPDTVQAVLWYWASGTSISNNGSVQKMADELVWTSW